MAKIRVQAPVGTDPLLIAQAIVGPHTRLKAEHVPSRVDEPFVHWKALTDLYKRSRLKYRAQMDRMLQHITRYVEDNITGYLAKADLPPKPLLTPEQLRELANIITDYHTAFAISIGAETGLPKAQIQALIDTGILPPETFDLMQDAHTYGQLMGSLRAFDVPLTPQQWDYDKFKKYVERRPIPTTPQEEAAIEWSRHSTGMHIVGLGNKIADDFSTVAIAEDADLRREYLEVIKDVTVEGIKHRETWKIIESNLGHATGDWARDFGRIAATETQNAFQEGFAQSLMDREGDPDGILVAKIPSPDACPDCVRLHLTAGQGSKPRIFTLSELEANGTNVKVKRNAWKAVVGAIHPFCSCELVHVPPGWGFEDEPGDDEEHAWDKVPGNKDAYRRKDEQGDWIYWSARLEPKLERSELRLKTDLMKSFMQYTDVPEEGCIVRVGDPVMRQEIEKVLDRAPVEIFNRRIGATLITTDIPRPQVALEDNDLAYWTGNEIRVAQTLPAEKIKHVMEHELGHTLNVFLMNKFRGEEPVYKWHDKLNAVSQDEGYVSEYAEKAPIENAAEVTRMYLFDRARLMLDYPKQYAFAHEDYKDAIPPLKMVWKKGVA